MAPIIEAGPKAYLEDAKYFGPNMMPAVLGGDENKNKGWTSKASKDDGVSAKKQPAKGVKGVNK